MSRADLDILRPRVREYLTLKGREINSKNLTRCFMHSDDHPSAIVYEKNLHCPVCAKSWDIFALAGLILGTDDFKSQLADVQKTLGMAQFPDLEPKEKKQQKKPAAVPPDRAPEVYQMDEFRSRARQKNWGSEITDVYRYTDVDGNIIAIDVRYEGGEKKKEVITWWYDGERLAWYGAPVLIYNLHGALKSGKPILIVEGGKCVKAVALSAPFAAAFTPVSWNGGSAKAHLADWSVLAGRDVYMYPDDDHKIDDKTGQEFPAEKQPGIKAALAIKKQLPNLKIIPPLPAARAIKPDGADIVEALQVATPEDIIEYIRTTSPMDFSQPGEPVEPTEPRKSVTDSSLPYRALGIADDGRAHFIDSSGRSQVYKLNAIGKSELKVLAPLAWWFANYADGTRVSWEQAVDDVIRLSQSKSFDVKNIRGRGCWKESDGRLCYHDGETTVGDYDPGRVFLRKSPQNIGISDEAAPLEIREKIRDTVHEISFATKTDAIRCLGWSVLAPFAGAWDWRPSLLLTGEARSGKTTVGNQIMKRLANCYWLHGGETTVAGTRGLVERDSCGILYDEIEGDTQKKKLNRDELFSLMRASVSDDAPDTVKGTKDGGYVSYKMTNMFAFIGIDPTIEHVADESRIFQINMTVPTNGERWNEIQKRLDHLLTDKNCRAVRSFTWQNIRTIKSLAAELEEKIMSRTHERRFSHADALLSAAYLVVWRGVTSADAIDLDKYFAEYYACQPIEEHRSDAAETVTRLMDEIIEITVGRDRVKLTIIEALTRLYTDTVEDENTYAGNRPLSGDEKTAYRQHLERYGLKIIDCDRVAISGNSHHVMRIIGRGKGYAKIFRRHGGYTETRNVRIGGATRSCVILAGLVGHNDDRPVVPGTDDSIEAIII